MSKKLIIIQILFSICVTIYCLHFPTGKFFGLDNITSNQNIIERLICSHDPESFKVCRCDSNCMKFKSCCIDALWDHNSSMSLDIYLKHFLKEALKYPDLKCELIIGDLPKTHTAETIFMMSTCPEDSNQDDIYKCIQNQRNTYLLPVQDKSGRTYKNKYCAICNGVLEFEIMNVNADCENKISNDSSSILKQYSDCKFSLVKKSDNTVQSCNINAVVPCNIKNDFECQLCKSYAGGIQYNNTCFRNFHCFKNQYGNTAVRKIFNSSDEFCEVLSWDHGFGFGISFPSYSLLVSYSSGEQLREQTEGKLCSSGQIYDKDTDSCVSDIVCGHGYKLEGTKCEKIATVFTGLKNKMLNAHASKEMIIQGCLSSYAYYIHERNNSTNRSMFDDLNGINIFNNASMLIKKTYISNRTRNPSFKVYRTSSNVVHATELYGVDFRRSFSESKICAHPVIHSKDSFTISKNCFVFLNTSILYLGEYILFTYNDEVSNETYLITCEKFHLSSNCPLRRLTRYNHSTNNTITADNHVYFAEQYTPLNSGLGVCINKDDAVHKWVEVLTSVEGYLTLIGCSLSIIGYMCVILTYSCIPELRTIPGKNVVCLCLMLMLSDILMLSSVGTRENKHACKATAMILHYVVLSIQCWSGVVAFDIWSTFQGKSLKRDIRSKKRFLCYCLFAWICPLCVLTLCVILNETGVVVMGYGDHGVCWISNVTSRIVTYIVPVVIFTVLTTTALVYTLCCIRRHSKKSKKLLSKSGGDNVSLTRMALKLVLLLGVIEICGLLQTTNTTEGSLAFNFVFRLIYSVLRSFRGVFICLLYVVTDRVFTVYRKVRERRTYRSSTRFTSESRSRKSTQISTVDHNSSV